jgi:hypothetical protein
VLCARRRVSASVRRDACGRAWAGVFDGAHRAGGSLCARREWTFLVEKFGFEAHFLDLTGLAADV